MQNHLEIPILVQCQPKPPHWFRFGVNQSNRHLSDSRSALHLSVRSSRDETRNKSERAIQTVRAVYNTEIHQKHSFYFMYRSPVRWSKHKWKTFRVHHLTLPGTLIVLHKLSLYCRFVLRSHIIPIWMYISWIGIIISFKWFVYPPT